MWPFSDYAAFNYSKASLENSILVATQGRLTRCRRDVDGRDDNDDYDYDGDDDGDAKTRMNFCF